MRYLRGSTPGALQCLAALAFASVAAVLRFMRLRQLCSVFGPMHWIALNQTVATDRFWPMAVLAP